MIIKGTTKFCAIIGQPVGQTASPAMHNAAFQHLKLDYVYLPLLVQPEQLAVAVQGLRALNVLGFNVTIPHKEKVIAELDEIDPFAQKCGAVNTVIQHNHKLIGYNTDGPGFLWSLTEAEFSLADKKVVLLGAGGAAKAVAFSLIQAGIVSLIIVNRSVAKAETLAAQLKSDFTSQLATCAFEDPQLFRYLHEADLVINATALGMVPHEKESPLSDYSWVRPHQLCYDLIYKPMQTCFLQAAQAHGAQVLNGQGMLVGQGVLAFELFTGLQVPASVMSKALSV